VAIEALSFYKNVQRRQRFTKRLQQAAQRLDEAELRAFAEESLPFDNEALAIAQASPLDVDSDSKWWR
jgi:hypothetical protein